MQDNAPIHISHMVQDQLYDWAGRNGVQLLDWPPNSPDLNLKENVWKVLKDRISEDHPELQEMLQMIHSLEFLDEAANEEWYSIEDRIYLNLIQSMPRRLQAIIDANGWYTKY